MIHGGGGVAEVMRERATCGASRCVLARAACDCLGGALARFQRNLFGPGDPLSRLAGVKRAFVVQWYSL